MLEEGPKRKRVVAVAPDWPGLERGGRTEVEALETLEAYLPRYAKVARLARTGPTFASLTKLQVVERYEGIGSTDFWGISFACSRIDRARITADELARQLRLLKACWKAFDGVRARVSAEMRKGPRGGGRDRDRIVQHVLGVEQDWARKVGVRTPGDAVVTDEQGLAAYRADYAAAILAHHVAGEPARTWPLRFLVRHSAYHVLDHTWEMEDKDLTPPGAAR